MHCNVSVSSRPAAPVRLLASSIWLLRDDITGERQRHSEQPGKLEPGKTNCSQGGCSVDWKFLFPTCFIGTVVFYFLVNSHHIKMGMAVVKWNLITAFCLYNWWKYCLACFPKVNVFQSRYSQTDEWFSLILREKSFWDYCIFRHVRGVKCRFSLITS